MASIGPVSISTGSTPDEAGVDDAWPSGVRPSASAFSRGHQQHRGGAVGDLRRRAGGVDAVLAGDGLEVGRAPRGWSRAGPRRGRRGGWCRWACRRRRGRGRRSATIWVAKRSSAQAWAASCWDRRPNASVSARVMPHLSAMRSAPSNWRGELVLARSSSWGWRLPRSEPSAMLEPIGTWLMTSTPQATATSTTPRADEAGGQVGGLLRRAALGVDGGGGDRRAGSPAVSHAVRATLNDCMPTWLTQPPTTWPTSAGSMPGAVDQLACRTLASRSAEWMVDRPPPRRPIGNGRLRRSRRRSWRQPRTIP